VRALPDHAAARRGEDPHTVCYEILPRDPARGARLSTRREFRVLASQAVIDLLLETSRPRSPMAVGIHRQAGLDAGRASYTQEQFDIVLM